MYEYEELVKDTEAYRDSIATVDKDGKRIWLYPKQPKGKFYNYRKIVTYIFLLFFLAMPFIEYNGEPILLLNVVERKFILFGLLFMPQDTHLFALAMITFIVFIVLFTVVFGRLFCGWICPQTVFMEMIFRRIEYAIEGDANDQRRLDAAPWSGEKMRKKGLKHALFFLIAVIVANYFLAYIIGIDNVLKIIKEPISQHAVGFSMMLIFSGLFYGVFARLREQVCTTICPYGRLQSVLLVKDSIVVAYDHKRGEPRGKIKKTPTPSVPPSVTDPLTAMQQAVKTQGDCIDCKLCVQVCPTGIDIRNGTQLECTNCTACMDACDAIMERVKRPTGLIRYDSMTGIESGQKKIFTPRVIAYSVVLTILFVVNILLLGGRSDIDATILRASGQLYQEVSADTLSNLYTFKVFNKTHKELPVQLRIKDDVGKIEIIGDATPSVVSGGMTEGTFFVKMPISKLTGSKTIIYIDVVSNGKIMKSNKVSFFGY